MFSFYLYNNYTIIISKDLYHLYQKNYFLLYVDTSRQQRNSLCWWHHVLETQCFNTFLFFFHRSYSGQNNGQAQEKRRLAGRHKRNRHILDSIHSERRFHLQEKSQLEDSTWRRVPLRSLGWSGLQMPENQAQQVSIVQLAFPINLVSRWLSSFFSINRVMRQFEETTVNKNIQSALQTIFQTFFQYLSDFSLSLNAKSSYAVKKHLNRTALIIWHRPRRPWTALARSSRDCNGLNWFYIRANSASACRSYLILGQESDGGGQGGLTVTQRSIVIEWRDEWHRRMRRFQRRARSCHWGVFADREGRDSKREIQRER